MADGEIEVSVRADGVDDAAGELGGDGGASGRGGMGGDGRGRSGGQQNTFTKLLTRIAGLIVFLGPILDAIGVITNILTAFVAPVAVVLLRLLQPLIRLLLFVLPIWFEFVGFLDMVVQEVNELRNRFIDTLLELLGISDPIEAVRDGIDTLKDTFNDARDRLGNILDTLRNLPSNIADRLPSAGDVGGRARDSISDALLGGEDSRRRQAVNIGIGGGLEPFIDRVTRDGSVDFP